MSFIKQDPHRLVWQQDDRYLWIEAWAKTAYACEAAAIYR